MKRPAIGITVDNSTQRPDHYESPSHYAQAIERAGGLPVLLPYHLDLSLIPQLADILDGLLLSGGDDIDPVHYGETWHPGARPCDPARTRFELALLAEIERRRTPVLGICLGSQTMNVHRGGSLIQFLPDHPRDNPIEHRKLDDPSRCHPVQIDPDSVLARGIGRSSIIANTSHKQAVASVGRGLRVIATAPDGVIEGLEDPSLPLYLAVQWHPERLIDQPEHLAPFKLLVQAASHTP
jgi:putative glutamine amidotransferase